MGGAPSQQLGLVLCESPSFLLYPLAVSNVSSVPALHIFNAGQ